jgi:pyruvate dehydrogenase E2 component (dihydrolipoamide acetyltransferase)
MNPPVTERLNHAERWLRDGLAVLRPPLSAYQITIDMSPALYRLDELRREGVAATTTHLVVKAAARALAASPGLHQVVAGNRRTRPGRVDIGLSLKGEMFVTPVLIIEGADSKTVAEISRETARRTAEVQEADRRLVGTLRRWGWLIPLAPLRRMVLRLLFRSGTFRRRGAGTFQVSTVAVDWGLASTFATAGVLVAGAVRQAVVAVDGRPSVRPVLTLTLSGDHSIWNGQAAATFLSLVRDELSVCGQTASR